MDTLANIHTMEEVARMVVDLAEMHGLRYVHTVTVSLNGAHGGADLIIDGFDADDNECQIDSIVSR